jgi:hypothetical protein
MYHWRPILRSKRSLGMSRISNQELVPRVGLVYPPASCCCDDLNGREHMDFRICRCPNCFSRTQLTHVMNDRSRLPLSARLTSHVFTQHWAANYSSQQQQLLVKSMYCLKYSRVRVLSGKATRGGLFKLRSAL